MQYIILKSKLIVFFNSRLHPPFQIMQQGYPLIYAKKSMDMIWNLNRFAETTFIFIFVFSDVLLVGFSISILFSYMMYLTWSLGRYFLFLGPLFSWFVWTIK